MEDLFDQYKAKTTIFAEIQKKQRKFTDPSTLGRVNQPEFIKKLGETSPEERNAKIKTTNRELAREGRQSGNIIQFIACQAHIQRPSIGEEENRNYVGLPIECVKRRENRLYFPRFTIISRLRNRSPYGTEVGNDDFLQKCELEIWETSSMQSTDSTSCSFAQFSQLRKRG